VVELSSRQRVSSALLVFTAAGCVAGGADDTIDRVFDPCAPLVIDARDLRTDEIESVRAAADLWIEAIGAPMVVMGDGDGATASPMVPVQFDTAAPFFFGVYDDEHGVIVINRRIDGAGPRAITIAHELGHAFGLEHVRPSVRRSLMNPENLEIPPTPEDADAIRDLWGTCTP
jgi:hypothetical protein